MPLLTCQSLTKSYGARPLFQNITFGIGERERLGLIGPNGSGKSTLLKILAGLETPDGGGVSTVRGLRLCYLAQDERFAAGETVQSVLRSALAGQPRDAAEIDLQIEISLNKFSFPDRDQEAVALSGGWRKRLALARALITEPDLLLLDEPTNHLDLEGVLWLEKFLQNAPFPFVLISHDRTFLENVTNRVMELNPIYAEGFLSVDGKYSDFLTRREEYLAAQATLEAALVTKVKREIEWLRRGPQARTTKAQYRIDEAGRMIDSLADVKARNAMGKAAGIDFTASGRQTRDLLTGKSLTASVPGRTLFSGLDLILSPKQRLGLIGPNGSGKTTLIRLLTGQRDPDGGTIKQAEGLRVVLFDQNREQLDLNVALRDALSPNGETVIYQGNPMHVSGWAKRFLFRSEQLQVPLRQLSGGERARVLIARLMLQPADLLILDEPTNDLDIPTLEVLEDSLSEFSGALVLVTHDRFLLDAVSTEVLALDGEGGARYFADYAQWEAHQAPPPPPVKPSAAPAKPAASASRMTTAERKEWKQMEEKIEAAEARVSEIERQMTLPEVTTDAARLQQLWEELPQAKADVSRLYERWEELEAKQ